MEGCLNCPRKCKINRSEGRRGFCGETEVIRAARAALHYWEEPCISGTNGSGAVFFTGCVLRCVYCQNHEIAGSKVGREVSVDRLTEIFLELQEKQANNINLVTPTHFVQQIRQALLLAKEKGLHIPVVYNTGGYENVETLRQLEGLVDIYLPDFKYLDADHAEKYSCARDYPEVAKNAIAEMVRQVGAPKFDEQGMMQKGVIVRHLLLPGCLLDAKRIVRYLYETYQEQIYFSLMNQYTPLDTLDQEKFPELARKVSKKSYEKLVQFALDLGVENAYIQEGDVAKESFIPAFDFQGIKADWR